MKPTIRQRGIAWEVRFYGKDKNEYSSIICESWADALEVANRSGHKEHTEAVFGEYFLRSANRALQKMKDEL